MIDLASDPGGKATVESRYAGVEGARFFFSGFGDEALQFIPRG